MWSYPQSRLATISNEWNGTQYDSFVGNGIRDVLWNRSEAKESSKAVLDLVLDGIIEDEELCKLYFGELRCEELAKTVSQHHSGKRSHGHIQEQTIDQARLEEVFATQQKEFYEDIKGQIRALEKKVKDREQQKVQVKTTTRLAVNETPELLAVKEVLSKKNKALKQLKPYPRDNAGAIKRLEEEIGKLEVQRDNLIAALKEEHEPYDKTKLEAVKKEINKLELIIDWGDNKSRFYQECKKQFIHYKILPLLKTQEHEIEAAYNEQTQEQQKRIVKRIKTTLSKYKISIDPNDGRPLSQALQSEITMARETLTTVVNLKEHLFSIVLELIQIMYLERVLQRLYPGKNIKVRKPPCVDDLRANTDCVIRLEIPEETRVVHMPVDLKNSITEEYLQTEKGKWPKGTLHGLHHCIKATGKPKRVENYVLAFNPNIINLLFNKIIQNIMRNNPIPGNLSKLFTSTDYLQIQRVSPHRNMNYTQATDLLQLSIQQLFQSNQSTDDIH